MLVNKNRNLKVKNLLLVLTLVLMSTSFFYLSPAEAYTETILPAPIVVKVVSKHKAYQVRWTKVARADGYYVYKRIYNAKDGEKDFFKIGTTASTNFTDKHITKKSYYSYCVKPYYKESNGYTTIKTGGKISGLVHSNSYKTIIKKWQNMSDEKQSQYEVCIPRKYSTIEQEAFLKKYGNNDAWIYRVNQNKYRGQYTIAFVSSIGYQGCTSGLEDYSYEEYAVKMNAIYDRLDDKIANAETTADKLRIFAEELNDHGNYDSEYEASYSKEGPFLKGKFTCEGLSRATEFLCEHYGINAGLASGGNHMWNVVENEGTNDWKMSDILATTYELNDEKARSEEIYCLLQNYEPECYKEDNIPAFKKAKAILAAKERV